MNNVSTPREIEKASKCWDCAVDLGNRHEEGCAIARCTLCGFQRIACECEGGEPTIWKGTFPGEIEVERYGFKDLNELASRANQGLLTWNSGIEQWEKRPPKPPVVQIGGLVMPTKLSDGFTFPAGTTAEIKHDTLYIYFPAGGYAVANDSSQVIDERGQTHPLAPVLKDSLEKQGIPIRK